MNFDLPAEDDPRRQEVRAWFNAHLNPTGRDLLEAGYAVPHWPRPWGLAADPELQIIIEDEMKRAGVDAPNQINPVAINNCAQTLLTHGTKEQQEKFLPPALSLEAIWCMLFSEPSGGSDLAALRTTAKRQGDHYVVKGHKIWISLAHAAKVGVLIARTDSNLPKRRGLSAFLVDMNWPGIEITPIIDMSGAPNEYNEVILDDVIVPADRLLGKEGQGWEIAMSQLATERVAISRPGAIWGSGPTARELLTGLHEVGALEDPVIREQAAQLYAEGEVLRLLAYRSLSDRINARPAGPEGAVRKIVAGPHGQRLLELAKAVQGPAGLLQGQQPFPGAKKPGKGHGAFDDWDYSFWFSPGATIGIGTQEILKNVTAERILGLPYEADPSARLPFADTLLKSSDR